MKKLYKWTMLTLFAGGTLFGTSCATDLRDAAIAGLFDYVTDTAAGLAAAVSPFDDFVEVD